MMSLPRRFSIFVFVSVILAVAVAVGGFALWYLSHLHRPGLTERAGGILIPKGVSPERISAIISEAGIPHSPFIYALEDARRGNSYNPKAGEFTLPARASLADVLGILHKGESIQHSFTIPEGQTVAEFLAALDEKKCITENITADYCFTGDISVIPDEGELLPETYFFIRGTSRDDFINRIMAAREIAFASLWAERQDNLPFKTLGEAVVLASIIEKETGVAGERGLVASVFVNRLRRGMRLQSDPTVLYGLIQAGEGREKLRRSDLRHDSPWNTYANSNLPPTPICNPGLASLIAALNPADSPYLYFVADGTGGHAFAVTLDEHNRNVAAWRAIQQGNN